MKINDTNTALLMQEMQNLTIMTSSRSKQSCNISPYSMPGIECKKSGKRLCPYTPSMNRIAQQACTHWGITLQQLRSKNNSTKLCNKRKMLYGLFMEHIENIGTSHIGRFIERNHGSVIKALVGHKSHLEKEPEYKQEYLLLCLFVRP